MAKNTNKCVLKGCGKTRRMRDLRVDSKFCAYHVTKATISAFLCVLYTSMSRRTRGLGTKRPDLYKGKPIMSRDTFVSWARNHPDFLRLYKQWFNADFDRKLTPTVNRMKSIKGYTLDNVEWMTNAQNCGLASSVKSMNMNAKKEIYNLLGINSK